MKNAYCYDPLSIVTATAFALMTVCYFTAGYGLIKVVAGIIFK